MHEMRLFLETQPTLFSKQLRNPERDYDIFELKMGKDIIYHTFYLNNFQNSRPPGMNLGPFVLRNPVQGWLENSLILMTSSIVIRFSSPPWLYHRTTESQVPKMVGRNVMHTNHEPRGRLFWSILYDVMVEVFCLSYLYNEPFLALERILRICRIVRWYPPRSNPPFEKGSCIM